MRQNQGCCQLFHAVSCTPWLKRACFGAVWGFLQATIDTGCHPIQARAQFSMVSPVTHQVFQVLRALGKRPSVALLNRFEEELGVADSLGDCERLDLS